MLPIPKWLPKNEISGASGKDGTRMFEDEFPILSNKVFEYSHGKQCLLYQCLLSDQFKRMALCSI